MFNTCHKDACHCHSIGQDAITNVKKNIYMSYNIIPFIKDTFYIISVKDVTVLHSAHTKTNRLPAHPYWNPLYGGICHHPKTEKKNKVMDVARHHHDFVDNVKC